MRRHRGQERPQVLPQGGEEFGTASHHDLGSTLRFLRALWQLNHALESASRRMKRTYGITGPERLFIRIVGQRPGITPSELASVMSVDRSTVTPLLKRLEARHIVRRSRNPADARSVHLTLMPAGARFDGMREGTIESCVRDAIGSSDAYDVATAAALLVKISQSLRKGHVRSAGWNARPATKSLPRASVKNGRPGLKRHRR